MSGRNWATKPLPDPKETVTGNRNGAAIRKRIGAPCLPHDRGSHIVEGGSEDMANKTVQQFAQQHMTYCVRCSWPTIFGNPGSTEWPFLKNFHRDFQYVLSVRNFIAQLTVGETALKNETGMEVFYDFVITPAVRLIPTSGTHWLLRWSRSVLDLHGGNGWNEWPDLVRQAHAPHLTIVSVTFARPYLYRKPLAIRTAP
jgi:hypothetical protein